MSAAECVLIGFSLSLRCPTHDKRPTCRQGHRYSKLISRAQTHELAIVNARPVGCCTIVRLCASIGTGRFGPRQQHITIDAANDEQQFNTTTATTSSIFSLTVIPIVGWFKLLPAFGGCVVTAASCKLQEGGVVQMKVDDTTARPVPGCQD
jgi:hypothetical protein